MIPERAAAELRRLTQARERAIERRTSLVHQVYGLVFTVFPEFLWPMKNIKTKTAHYLLKQSPRPRDIVAIGCEPLTEIMKKISRGKLGKARAEALYKAAVNSVGVREGQGSMVFEISQLMDGIEKTECSLDEIEGKMKEYLKKYPTVDLCYRYKG